MISSFLEIVCSGYARHKPLGHAFVEDKSKLPRLLSTAQATKGQDILPTRVEAATMPDQAIG